MSRWLLAGLMALARHPMHSSSALVTVSPDGRLATVEVRAFADDFPPGTDSARASAYLARRFMLRDRAGRVLPLGLRRLTRDGAVIVVTLESELAGGLSGSAVWHGVLSERFTDQVNLVRARYAGRTVSLLFTATDGAKPLP